MLCSEFIDRICGDTYDHGEDISKNHIGDPNDEL